jgi:Tol biopolymer transport system component
MPICRVGSTLTSTAILLTVVSLSAQQGKRPMSVDDIYNVREVRDPQRSPDGRWIAYTVTRAIKDTDKNDTDVWMVSWDGKDQIQVTSTPESESTPRWSPDGKYLCLCPRAKARSGRRSGC